MDRFPITNVFPDLPQIALNLALNQRGSSAQKPKDSLGRLPADLTSQSQLYFRPGYKSLAMCSNDAKEGSDETTLLLVLVFDCPGLGEC